MSSQPMEAGWASEAIFFIHVEEIKGDDVKLHAKAELSPDGINWVDEGTVFPVMKTTGYYFVKLTHFGNWLRVSGSISGGSETMKLSVHLHLKA